MPYSLSPVEIHKFSLINQPKLHSFNPNNPISRHEFAMIRCCNKRVSTDKFRLQKDYYELLGVTANSTPQEIKEAYRKLQKKYHPDIAGQKGHEHTMMLNEAYRVLMRKDLRRAYDTSSGRLRNKNAYAGYSSWKGHERPQALFVDENACIGCRECVHHASNTFIMDEDLGCARVKVQYGDNQQKLEVSVDSCPVNCIYWVDKEEVAVLEFLMHPQPKEGYGVFGNGWEKPSNVFAAAKSFKKQLERQAAANGAKASVDEETPAQAEARAKAIAELEKERFSGVWRFFQSVWHKNLEG